VVVRVLCVILVVVCLWFCDFYVVCWGRFIDMFGIDRFVVCECFIYECGLVFF